MANLWWGWMVIGVNKHILPLLAPMFAAALIISGCGDTNITADSGGGRSGITVTAIGEAVATPDTLHATLTANGSGVTAVSAWGKANVAADHIREVLDGMGAAERQYSTTSLYVNPEYRYTQQGQDTVGYIASQTFEVVFTDIESAGETIDEVVRRGGGDVYAASSRLEVSDTGVAAVAARKDAVDKAREKAESYAGLLGVEIGDVQYMLETSAPNGGVYDQRGAMTTEKTGTVIDPGTQKIIVSIEIHWSLRGRS